MKGAYLIIYVQEHQRRQGVLLYEWILERARGLGVHGGSAFRAIAGFGRHGVLHEESFFELAGNLPIKLAFMVSEEEKISLLEMLEKETPGLFYLILPAECGVFGADKAVGRQG